ncbi:MAG TPA: FAD-binding protein, partial [Firmicutes bacterium]|nr:FAD-binding protein [Bacillota bacterium]
MKKNVYFGIILLAVLITALALARPQATESPPLPTSVDVVVVGRGLPALAAALEANRQGAEVMILDSQQLREDFFYPLGGSFVVAREKATVEGEEEEKEAHEGLAAEELEAVLA